MELVAVTTLMGVFAAVAVSRSDGLFADAAARTRVEEFAALMHDAKRRAILTGDSHGVAFTKSGGAIASARIERETSPGVWADADEAFAVPDGLQATSAADHARFSFEGVPLHAGVTIDFVGPHQTWRLTSPPHSGSIQIEQIP